MEHKNWPKIWNEFYFVVTFGDPKARGSMHPAILLKWKTAKRNGQISLHYLSRASLMFFCFLLYWEPQGCCCGFIPKRMESVSFPSLMDNHYCRLIHLCPNFRVSDYEIGLKGSMGMVLLALCISLLFLMLW